jgi:transposase
LAPPDDEHDCGWKAYAAAQEQKLAELTDKLAALERRLFEKKSERRLTSKLPPPLPKAKRTPDEARQTRKDNAALRDARVETEVTPLPVGERPCPRCNGARRHIGTKSSIVWEYVQPFFRKRVYERETVRCSCGCIETAPAPERMGDKTRYASSFVAHLIVNKCAHSNPQHRLEKAYRDLGIPMSRSTMCNLIHRAARELQPLHAAALALVPRAPDVHADETSMRQQDHEGRCYLWTFVTSELVVYRYATTRSGSVPQEILGNSQGRLIVDQYTGYNAVASLMYGGRSTSNASTQRPKRRSTSSRNCTASRRKPKLRASSAPLNTSRCDKQNRSRSSFSSCGGVVDIADASDLVPRWGAPFATCSRITAPSAASCAMPLFLSTTTQQRLRYVVQRWVE